MKIDPLDTDATMAWNPQGIYQWLAYALIAAGWILATALIAGITRVLTRN